LAGHTRAAPETITILFGSDAPVISTTADVNTFFRALFSGCLLPAAQLAQMKRTVPAADLGTTEPGTGQPDEGPGLPGPSTIVSVWRVGDAVPAG
jgi:hypothetical protein